MKYKQVYFIYMSVMGFMVFFTNQDNLLGVPISVLVLLVQLIYILILVLINPYQMSLKIHTIGLFTCQIVFTVFIIFINIINFSSSIDELVILVLAYFILGCCLVIIVFTAIRLYYEYRFG